MNRKQRKMVAIVVVVLAGLYLVNQFRSRSAAQDAAQRAKQEAEARKAEEARRLAMEQVVYLVPVETIPKRTVITDRMVREVKISKKDAPWAKVPEAMKQHPTTKDEVVGKIALVNLEVGEPIRFERLAGKNDLRAISFLIKPGMRAVTIPISSVDQAVGGFIRQGDLVDVLGTFPLPGTGETITKPILQSLRILVVDNIYHKAEDDKPEENEEEPEEGKVMDNPNVALARVTMVTFEVTPEQAEMLVLASSKIPLKLVLRNPIDDKLVEGEEGVAANDDLFINPMAPPPEPQGQVELILGESRNVKKVGVR